MSFSFQHEQGAHQIAVVRWPGNLCNNRVVYISDEPPKEAKAEEKKVVNSAAYRKIPDERKVFGHFGQSPMSAIGGPDFLRARRTGQSLRQSDVELFEDGLEAYEEGEGDIDADFTDVDRPGTKALLDKKFRQAKQQLVLRRRDFDLEQDGHLDPVCNPDERECIFIVGRAKSGKSVWAAKYMMSYARTHKDHPIVVFSTIEDDPAFADIPGVEFVDLRGEGVVDKIKGVKLSECLCVFDDIDPLADSAKPVFDALVALRGQLLETGRHSSVYVLNTSHHFRAHARTKAANTESTAVVLFPRSGDHYFITDYMKVYGGLTKDQIQRVMQLPSRWCLLHRGYPAYVLHEHGAYFLEVPKPKPKAAELKEEKKSSKKAPRRMFD